MRLVRLLNATESSSDWLGWCSGTPGVRVLRGLLGMPAMRRMVRFMSVVPEAPSRCPPSNDGGCCCFARYGLAFNTSATAALIALSSTSPSSVTNSPMRSCRSRTASCGSLKALAADWIDRPARRALNLAVSSFVVSSRTAARAFSSAVCWLAFRAASSRAAAAPSRDLSRSLRSASFSAAMSSIVGWVCCPWAVSVPPWSPVSAVPSPAPSGAGSEPPAITRMGRPCLV